MTLARGTRLGPYEIIDALGAGGMGEVFRARDTKLNRDVAIRVLPATFADDPERLARFTREAQTLASLNHPNIAPIYGIEEVPATGVSGSGSRALVMEPRPSRRRPGRQRSRTRSGALYNRRVDGREMKVLGRRRPGRGGLEAASSLLDLVVRLRGSKPFIPRGVHRFKTFEESEAWSIRMMARRSSRDRLG